MKKKLIEFFSNFGGSAGQASILKGAESLNFLYSHRLKRKLDEYPSERSHADKSFLGNKFFIVSIILALSFLQFRVVLAAPFLTLSSFSGNATTISVSGGGFQNGETVNIYLGSASNASVASAVAGNDSLFGPTSVSIPLNSPQGPLEIIGVGVTSGISQSNSYFVVPFSASITEVTGPNTPGSTAQVSGEGFSPGESVNLVINGSVGGTALANSEGAFSSASFTVPNVAVGTHELHALGQSSGADGVYYFYVGGFYPSASPSTYYLLPGEALSFSGGGFAAGESITVTSPPSIEVLATFNANSSGEFTDGGSLVIPLNTTSGIKLFRLTGQSSGGQAEVAVTIGSFSGSFSPSAYWLTPGQTLSFSGSGFAGGETINVYLNTNTSPVSSFTAEAGGSFENAGSIEIPFSFAGAIHEFRLAGESSGAGGMVNIMVGGFFPSITPSAWWLIPGQSFNFSGSGFAPNEEVNISIQGGATAAANAGADGSFEASPNFSAPISGTNISVTATGELSGAEVSLDIALGSLHPLVTPSSYYVPSGGTINFFGSGFISGEEVEIKNGTTVLGSVNADGAGEFTSEFFSTMFGPTRTVSYSFTGQTSGAAANVEITVAGLNPYAEADSYYVTPGSSVNVRGFGFGANEGITITAGSNTVHTTANSLGNASTTAIVIPLGLSGSVNVDFTGDTSGANASVPITLAPFLAQVFPSTYWTMPGSQVTFTGSGFSAGESVSVSLNGTALTSSTAASDGSLNAGPITIPFSASVANFEFSALTSGSVVEVNVALGTLSPGIWLSNYYDVGGSALTVFGGGFGPNEIVNVTFEGTTLGSETTDSGGNFTLVTTVPFGPGGNKTIQARGSSSGVTAPSVTFTQPQIFVSVELGAYAGAPGNTVNFIGSGFLPNEPINITTDRSGSTVVHTFNASAGGTFNNSGYSTLTSFTEGPLVITITGTQSFVSKSINYYVTGP